MPLSDLPFHFLDISSFGKPAMLAKPVLRLRRVQELVTLSESDSNILFPSFLLLFLLIRDEIASFRIFFFSSLFNFKKYSFECDEI